jgi:hypothetical protein
MDYNGAQLSLKINTLSIYTRSITYTTQHKTIISTKECANIRTFHTAFGSCESKSQVYFLSTRNCGSILRLQCHWRLLWSLDL